MCSDEIRKIVDQAIAEGLTVAFAKCINWETPLLLNNIKPMEFEPYIPDRHSWVRNIYVF